MEALAAAVGTTRQTIYRYESGIIQTPPYDKVEALAAVLDCPPADLLGWSEESGGAETLAQARVALMYEGADFSVTAFWRGTPCSSADAPNSGKRAFMPSGSTG